MRAAVVDPGDELRPLGGGGGTLHQVAPFGAGVGGQRVLFTLGRTARAGLAEIDQTPTTGLITLREQAFRNSQLIHRQLGVALRVILGDRALAGLDVDHHQPPGAVAFEPVEAAAHPYPGQSLGVALSDHAVDLDLGAHLGEFVPGLRAPPRERRQHRPVPCKFVVGVPLGVERKLFPDSFEFAEHLALVLARVGHQGVQ